MRSVGDSQTGGCPNWFKLPPDTKHSALLCAILREWELSKVIESLATTASQEGAEKR